MQDKHLVSTVASRGWKENWKETVAEKESSRGFYSSVTVPSSSVTFWAALNSLKTFSGICIGRANFKQKKLFFSFSCIKLYFVNFLFSDLN